MSPVNRIAAASSPELKRNDNPGGVLKNHNDAVAASIADTRTQIAALQADILRQTAELRLVNKSSEAGAAVDAANLAQLRNLRGADPAIRKPKRLGARVRKPTAR